MKESGEKSLVTVLMVDAILSMGWRLLGENLVCCVVF